MPIIAAAKNKKNCMLWYLAWRAITGRHTDITLSFLVVGHTKFSPDWCFGLLNDFIAGQRLEVCKR